ncbi:MAG: hypothetical protein QNK20_16650 [Aureibaculum sp.]|nr:hypothetical protein [Aureibaculum sp.]
MSEEYNENDHKPIVNLDSLLEKSIISLDRPPERPPIIMKIGQKEGFKDYTKRRLLTLGNISTITGKGKSKKTFLSSMICAAFVSNNNVQNKFFSYLPKGKEYVIRFDTEQGGYDAYRVGKVVKDLSGGYSDTYTVSNLREYENRQRVDIIDHAVKKFKGKIGVILIDGIADLVSNINDIEESKNVIQKLMTWTSIYNIHVCCVIHQNKDNGYATGHLGSELIKKSEVVISVVRQGDSSQVSCDNIRGAAEFDDFNFRINEDALPEIIENEDLSSYEVKEVEF